MLLTAQSVRYFPAERLFMLLSFVSLWYLSSCSSPEFCDKDGCREIIGKGIVNVVNGLIWYCFNPPIDRCEKKYLKFCLSRKIYLSLPLTRMISVSIKLWQVWRYQQKDAAGLSLMLYVIIMTENIELVNSYSEEIINCFFFFSFT